MAAINTKIALAMEQNIIWPKVSECMHKLTNQDVLGSTCPENILLSDMRDFITPYVLSFSPFHIFFLPQIVLAEENKSCSEVVTFSHAEGQ